MRYVRLSDTDLDVSVVALGCGSFGGIGSVPELFGRGEDETQAYALLDAAREQGITLLDTANGYGGGRSEEWIGRWMAERGARDEVVLTTKVRKWVGPGPEDEGLSARHIRQQVEASLRRLRTDRIDLYLTHAPDSSVPIEETLKAMDEAVQAGKVRYCGLSNYSAAELDEAVRAAQTLGVAAPRNLQSGFSLLDWSAATDGRFAACQAHGVAFTAFSPLAAGWLSGKYKPSTPYPENSRMQTRPEDYTDWVNETTFKRIAALEDAAAQRGVSLPLLALAWALGEPAVSAIIVGPRRPDQLTPAIAALDLELTREEREELSRIDGTAFAAP